VEQWLLSVQHDEDDVDRFATNFARFSATLSRFGPEAVAP
jgi:glutamate-1-semialdehyde 2,1-aminomutase